MSALGGLVCLAPPAEITIAVMMLLAAQWSPEDRHYSTYVLIGSAANFHFSEERAGVQHRTVSVRREILIIQAFVY